MANSDASQIVTGTAFGPFSTIGYRASDADAAVRISDWSWPIAGELDEDTEEYANLTLSEMDALFTSMRDDYKVGYQDYLDSTIDIVFRKDIAAGA